MFGYPPFFFLLATVAPRHHQSNKQSESIMDEAFSVALLCSAVVSAWRGGGHLLQATAALLFIQRGMSMQQRRSLSALQSARLLSLAPILAVHTSVFIRIGQAVLYW